MDHSTRQPKRRRSKPRGFTLLEVALAIVIVTVGMLAMVDAQAAFLRSNMWSSHAATGTFLANEVREYTRHLPRHDPVSGLVLDGGTLYGWGPDAGEILVSDFDDVDDFDGISFSDTGTAGFFDGDLPGPIDAFGTVIPDIAIDGSVVAWQAMQGWSQSVTVRKTDPFDTSISYTASSIFGGADTVDEYPLRVTVEVYFQDANDPAPILINTVSWIVPR